MWKRALATLALVLALCSTAEAQFSGSPFGPGFGSNARGNSVPAWVPAGANFYADFVNNRAWDGISQTTIAPITSSIVAITNATPAKYSPSACAVGATCVTSISANTLGLGANGVQVFGGVTNLLTQSNNFSNSAWVKQTGGTGYSVPVVTNPTCGGGVPCDPAGGNPWQIVFSTMSTASTGDSQIFQSFTTTVGDVYTCSIYGLAPSGTNPVLFVYLARNSNPFDNLSPLTLVAPTTTTWTRYQATGIALTTSTRFMIAASNGVSATQGVGGTFYFYGAQCVDNGASTGSAGNNPGPYVPTTTTTATSAGDQITAAGDFATALASSGAAVTFATTDGLHSNPFQTEYQQTPTLWSNGSTNYLTINATNHPATPLSATLSNARSGSFDKPASVTLAWGGSTGTVNLNGANTSDSGHSRTTSCASSCYLGSTNGSSNFWNGHIASIAVYPSQITPAVTSAPLTSIDFNIAGSSNFGSANDGDTNYSAIGPDGNLYANADDSLKTGNVSNSANNLLRMEQASGPATWVPGTAPAVVNLVQTFNNTTVCTGGPTNHCYFGNDTGLDVHNANWKNTGIASVLGQMYYASGKNTYYSNYANCADFYASWTCDPGIQYFYYGILQESSTGPGTAGWPLTSTTTWTSTASGTSISQYPTTTNSTSNVNGPSGCTPPITSGCAAIFPTNYFSQISPVHFGPDQNPGAAAGVYGGGSTPWCVGAVAGGCPDGAGTYFYAIANDGAYNTGNSIQLGRVTLANLPNLNQSDWSFWNSAGGGCTQVITDNNCWTSTLTSTTPILGTATLQTQPNCGLACGATFPAGQLGAPAMTYLPVSGRYIMLTWFHPPVYYHDTSLAVVNPSIIVSWSEWDIWEAPHPQGPWTLVQQQSWQTLCNGTGGTYGTSGAQCGTSGVTQGNFGNAGCGTGFYSPHVPEGAIVNGTNTDGGLTGAIFTAGNWNTGTCVAKLYSQTYLPVAFNY